MKNYQATFVLNKDDDKTAKNIEDIFKTAGAKVTQKEDWGIRKLAYLIKKQNKAKYLYFEFEIDPVKMPKLEAKLKLEENIMRSLVVVA